MTSSSPTRRRARLLGAATLAGVVVAGGLTSFGTGTAAAALLPAPPVVGPSDAASVQKEVVLDWAPVAGAASYVVQVGTDEEWSDEPTLELPTVATRVTLPTSLPHASYVWRVAAVGADGQGHWSSVGTFTRGWQVQPQLLAPTGSVDPSAGVPTFRWTPVPGASEYQLQLSTSPFTSGGHTQANATTQSCFTTRTTVTPYNGQVNARNDGAGDCSFTLLSKASSLHWRVRPLDRVVGAAPLVDTTPVVDEGISSQPPSGPGELDTSPCPEEADPVSTSAPVAGASPRASASASPSASAGSSASPSPGAPASASPSGSASPSDGSGSGKDAGSCDPAHTVEEGAWSAPAAFTHVLSWPRPAPYFADLPAPASPTAAAESCTERTCRDFPTVSWARVPGAQWYRVSVALDADYRNIQAVVETPGLSWTPTDQWRDSTAGAAYHVVVQACTVEPAADGRRAGCDTPSAPLLFRKSSPKLALTAPAAGAAVGGSEVVLSWQSSADALAAATGAPATSEAHAYRVQVTRAGDPGFAAPLVDEGTVDGTHHVSAKVRYADGQHLWRVQPVDASGHRLPWSATGTFTRDGTAPTFTVGTAGKLAPTGAVAVVFSEPVTGLSARTVRMSGVLATVSASSDGRRALLAVGRPLLPGAGHTITVEPGLRDRAGNAVAARTVSALVDPVVDDRSAVMVLSGSWKRLVASNAVGRTWSRSVPTAARPASASVALHGRAAEVKGCVGPSNGQVDVFVDGVRAARVDGYRSWSACGVVLTRATFTKAGPHRVLVRGTGTKSARSRGTAVAVDAITAVR